jgi:hypothetical protein
MTARGKTFKRKRRPSMSFGELVRKLWQPDSEELEPKVVEVKQNSPAEKAGAFEGVRDRHVRAVYSVLHLDGKSSAVSAAN